MEEFNEFLRIALHGACLVALIICIILSLCMLYSAWEDNKKQKKQKKIDCLAMCHGGRAEYIPLQIIDHIVISYKCHCDYLSVAEVFLKYGFKSVIIYGSATLSIEQVDAKRIKQPKIK